MEGSRLPGNQIAAPLNGNRRKNGLTHFLDPSQRIDNLLDGPMAACTF